MHRVNLQLDYLTVACEQDLDMSESPNAAQLTPQMERTGEDITEITCKVAQERKAESITWDNLCRIFEYHVVTLSLL